MRSYPLHQAAKEIPGHKNLGDVGERELSKRADILRESNISRKMEPSMGTSSIDGLFPVPCLITRGYSLPVVPHKAVAEVSKIGNL